MKTVTLDDAAYERLKAWKRGGRESFSSVVKRIVPAPGSLGGFASFVEVHGTEEMPGGELLEDSVDDRSAAKHDPWT